MPYGYGNILDVDLSTRKIDTRPVESRFAEEYLGGMGFGCKLLYDEVGPDADPLGEIAAGGVSGTVISNPFSLEGYSPDDKPTLYFSYFLEVEPGDDYAPPEGPSPEQNDSFRAYAAGDDGRWLLLATNDSFRSLGFADEYDTYDDTKIPVQQLFDDSDAWRQAPGSRQSLRRLKNLTTKR